MDITNDFIDLNCTTDKCKIAPISKLDGNCTVIQELIVNEDGSTSEIKTKHKNVNSIDANGINTQAANVSSNKEVDENRMAIDVADTAPLDKGFDENKVITDTAAVKNNDIMIQFIGTKEDVCQNGSIEIENKGLKDTDVCNDIAVPEMPLNLTVDNRFRNKNSISMNLNSNTENKETGTEEATMISVLSTENHTKSNSTTLKGSVSQSPFKEYLFWPQNKLNDKQNKEEQISASTCGNCCRMEIMAYNEKRTKAKR
ncbi:uncharacterized protein LOC143367044 [Andrena cerasifolii]|uniref:uncharacterized protein LOC143367044 n=1 Tax=Andrena cerasifolii TaxID=2819439 RepID=UPI004037AB58